LITKSPSIRPHIADSALRYQLDLDKLIPSCRRIVPPCGIYSSIRNLLKEKPVLSIANNAPEFPYDSNLILNLENRTAELENKALKLTRKEFDLLAMLMRHAGEVVPREALLAAVWGYQAGVRTRTLDVHVRRLRVHLERPAGPSIETVFGIGYRFQPYRARLFDTPTIAPTEQFCI
jgi:hypothetical protein